MMIIEGAGELNPVGRTAAAVLPRPANVGARTTIPIILAPRAAPSEAVAALAKGADVLVHETMHVPALEKYIREQIAKGRPVKFEPFMAHMHADHTPTEDVGRVAQEAGVKTLVLSHLTPAIDSISDDTWRAPAAKFFKGEIIVAKELMVV